MLLPEQPSWNWRDQSVEIIKDKRDFNSYPYQGPKLEHHIGGIDPEDPDAERKRQEYLAFMKLMSAYQSEKKQRKLLNVLAISTTMMPIGKGRNSTSERALEMAISHARDFPRKAGITRYVETCQTAMIKLRDLELRFCEGYYSMAKSKCNWPCVISGDRMDNPADKMDAIYWGIAHWADIVFIGTPIRYGNAGALYYKMIERLNAIHNEMTLRNHHVIEDKVAGFVITGGQDGVQAVAGQMLTFWSELGFMFSRYSYAGWNRGWYAEDTKKNYNLLNTSEEFKNDVNKVVEFAIDLKVRLDATRRILPEDYEGKSTFEPPIAGFISKGAGTTRAPTTLRDYEKYDPAAHLDV